MEEGIYIGDLKTHPQVQWLAKRTPRTAYSSTLDYDLLLQKNIKAQSSGRKDAWGEVWRKPGTSFQNPLPVKSTGHAYQLSQH